MKLALETLEATLRKHLARAGRVPESCRLIAVTKTYPQQTVTKARALGLTNFGENKVQEAVQKFPPLEDRLAGETLHLIGPLQTNKARQALKHFDMIHSVDRPKLVDTLARLRDEEGHCPKLFIQVNTGEEPQKAGVMPENLEALVVQARQADLPLIGLMCIPPADQAPAPHFAWLAKRARDLGLSELSMGMSQDYAAAAELGATYIRVGSALFGDRI